MTNSEISAIFFLIGFMLIMVIFKNLLNLYNQVAFTNPGLAGQFAINMFMIVIAAFMFFISMAMPNYLISKYNLNLFVDRITNSDFIGWIRFTRSKGVRFHIVKNGVLGQTQGVANGAKADVINNGDYTVITPNGNKCIITHDMLSHNINLERCVGWQLIKKHFGFLGYNAWQKAIEDEALQFKIEEEEIQEIKDRLEPPEEIDEIEGALLDE